jgi:hypothetical protein
MCQSKAYAGGDNENLAMATSLCVCLNTHLSIVVLGNFKNTFEMKAFIPCSLYSGSDDTSAHDKFMKLMK